MVKTIDSFKDIRTYLKKNIFGNKTFIGHEKEKQEIFDLLQRTVNHGESNSALLIGHRGSGKTTMVNAIIEELQNDEQFETSAILVRLNGYIHTDDRLALKSATTQMNLDNAVDGKVFGSFAENLAFLLACLQTGKKHTSKSVLFIMEEFDLFCAHHNQTLLYNLFDVSQSAQAPICILGITCRLDVIELLEKRVKSRFSHRQFFLFLGQDFASPVSNLDHALNRIEQLLMLPSNLKVAAARKKEWNSNLKTLLNDKKIKNIIQRVVDIDLTERTLKLILIKIVSQLNENKDTLTVEMFQESIKDLEKDEVLQVLQDCNVLELCLIIAMKHHSEIYDNQPMNFEMILNRYIKFVNKHSNIQNVERPVIMKAFEHIETLEIISKINAAGSRIQKEYQFFKLLVTPQQITEAVNKCHGLPTEVIQWVTSSLA